MTKQGGEVVPYDPFEFGLFSKDIFDFAPFCWPIWTRWPEFKDPVTVDEEDGQTVVRAEVPGIPVDQLEVSYDRNQVLRIRAEHREEKQEKGHKEKSYRGVDYRLRLPIDSEKAEATLEDGILTLRAPKGERIEATKIPVKAAQKK